MAYDVVVVGSGPGGATVARGLARAGASVLLLERGGDAAPTGRARQALRELWLPGRSLSLSGPWRTPVAILRGITLGGSSQYFFGTAWEPPYERLEPFGVDLRADVAALREELRPDVLPRELWGPRATLLADTARALGHDWRPVPKFVDQAALAATGHAGYGAARWTARRFITEAVTAGAEVRTGALVDQIVVRDGRTVGVTVRSRSGGEFIAAGTVVVAAGALGSVPLLRSAGLTGVGEDWFHDPVVAVNGTHPDLDADFEAPMCGVVEYADEGYMLTDLCRPPWVHEMLTVAGGRPDRARAYRRTLSVMVKVRDELSGHVSDRGIAHKPLTTVDEARLREGADVARELLAAAGATRLHTTARVAVHPGGTARIGVVVDADLATEVDGLHVCDASVLPVAWGVPPTFTVLALGTRLARRLAGTTDRSGALAQSRGERAR